MSSQSRIRDSIDFGRFPDEQLEILGRLNCLPEFGLDADLNHFADLCIKAVDAEVAAQQMRHRARKAAHDLMKKVAENWSKKEIMKATGYVP